jgi:acyl-coenzyme A synthetase/AMP-(fatty) acid ligase
MNLFFKDISKNRSYSWQDLISDIRCREKYSFLCKSDNYYDVFLNIIVSQLIGEEVILLDSDLTIDELKRLNVSLDCAESMRICDDKSLSQINTKNDLIEKLINTSIKWRLSLFTSGTTGIPKKVTHSFSTLTRSTRLGLKYKNDIWGLAYNPTHMAGLQVFYQALLNGNAIVRLFGLSRTEVLNEIRNNEITHISATPTFYRFLSPLSDRYATVKRLTFGGERFSKTLTDNLCKFFPNATIKNIYASTEAGSVLVSNNDTFTIKPGLENLVTIKNAELCLHKDLLGEYDFNSDTWYYTGDLVEIINNNPITFRFLSRKNEMINIGGYKINPLEVEEEIRKIDGVHDTYVFAKVNSVTGYILCCYIVRSNMNISESYVRLTLRKKLQEHKIPRLIYFKEFLDTTNTGKIKRIVS